MGLGCVWGFRFQGVSYSNPGVGCPVSGRGYKQPVLVAEGLRGFEFTV